MILQDLFSAGVLNSGTDFQVYREVGGLSGLDFAFTDTTAVYHTKVHFEMILYIYLRKFDHFTGQISSLSSHEV